MTANTPDSRTISEPVRLQTLTRKQLVERILANEAAIEKSGAAIAAAVQAENTSCANVCEYIARQAYNKCTISTAHDCAAAIRARREADR